MDKALRVNLGKGTSGLKADPDPGYTKPTSAGSDGGPFRKGKGALAGMANKRKGLSYGSSH